MLGYVQANSRLVEAFIGFTVALVAVEFFRRHSREKTALAAAALAAAWVTAGIAVFLDTVSGISVWAYLGFGLFAYCYLHAGVAVPSNRWMGLAVATTCFRLDSWVRIRGFPNGLRPAGRVAARASARIQSRRGGGQLALLAAFVLLGRLVGPQIVWRAAPGAASLLCAIGVYWFCWADV